MSKQQKPAAKRRKSDDTTSTTESFTTGQHPPQPSPPQYYTSPQNYPVQYATHAAYPFGSTQQQAYHPSPHSRYGSMPPPGYPSLPQMAQGSAHNIVAPVNSLVTPDSQQVSSSAAAFASPPSSLRRQPFHAAERGAFQESGKPTNPPCKYFFSFSHLEVYFPFDMFEIVVLKGILI